MVKYSKIEHINQAILEVAEALEGCGPNHPLAMALSVAQGALEAANIIAAKEYKESR